jgi:hypothetical protein
MALWQMEPGLRLACVALAEPATWRCVCAGPQHELAERAKLASCHKWAVG